MAEKLSTQSVSEGRKLTPPVKPKRLSYNLHKLQLKFFGVQGFELLL